MTHVPDDVRALERDLRGIFGGRLQSLVVYGNASTRGDGAQDTAGHGHARTPAHTLVVVDRLTADDLRSCAEHVAEWHRRDLATPLFLSAHEFGRSLDAFPLEFGAILADHTVVFGANPFTGLDIGHADLRRACEVQARSHLLHLREGFVETRGRADALAVLIVDSAASFAALVRMVGRLQGAPPGDTASTARHVERALELTGGAVSEVVKLAGTTEISSAAANRLFPGYLDAVERLVSYVDSWTSR